MTTLVFWAVRLDNIEHLFNVFFRTGRYSRGHLSGLDKGIPYVHIPGGFRVDDTYRNASRSRPVLADGAGPGDCVAGRLWGDALLAFGSEAVFKRFELTRGR